MICPECGEDHLERSPGIAPLAVWLIPGALCAGGILAVIGLPGRDIEAVMIGLLAYGAVVGTAATSGANRFAKAGFARCPDCGWFRDGVKEGARFEATRRRLRGLRLALLAPFLFFLGLAFVRYATGGDAVPDLFRASAIAAAFPTARSMLDIYRPVK